MSQPIIPERPFERIALSLSGGGYRAASFHLGSMSYLQRLRFFGKPLLENVRMISTVSGGTITGIVYALMKQENRSFEEVYDFLMTSLGELDLLKEGIQKLSPAGKWQNVEKTQNLINAFAELYDQHLTQGKTFSSLDNMKSHLECVVFNSTEFRHAINFRFRNRGSGFFGNKNISISHEAAGEIKLSDAMASSSCFTGGFEPLLFPKDFLHNDAIHLRNLQKTFEPLGLMDGGIYDNQGIESILLYNDSREERKFDLVIISDVASPYFEAYTATGERKDTDLRRLTIKKIIQKGKRINTLTGIALLLLALACGLIPLSDGYAHTMRNGILIGLGVGFLILFVVKVFVVGLIKKLGNYLQGTIKNFIPSFQYDKLRNLQIENMTFGRAEPLIMDRINSLVKLLMDVFLKVVRRLNFDKLYENDAFANRRISNLINELTERDFNNKKLRKAQVVSTSSGRSSAIGEDYKTAVKEKIKEIAEASANFGTTLWFNDDPKSLYRMLEMLVATGQFTMCYNLVVYLESIMYDNAEAFAKLPDATRREVERLYVDVVADWERFKGKPMFLSDELKTIQKRANRLKDS